VPIKLPLNNQFYYHSSIELFFGRLFMINTILIPTLDLSQAERFYDGFLRLFGASKFMIGEDSITWKSHKNSTSIVIHKYVHDQNNKSNNAIIGFPASSPNEVRLIYNAALRLGGGCAGTPSNNGYGDFSAYFYDVDLNKLGVFYFK
jgi:predicted lactoylglutathione lyase